MGRQWLKTRGNQIMALVMALMLLLLGRLFVLTVLQHDEWISAASENYLRSVYTAAPRGEIFDRYGRLMAGNRPTFTVQFSKGSMKAAELNANAAAVIGILEENGDSYIDNFPVVYENGVFFYSYQRDIDDWLASQGMPAGLPAEQAFDEIRRRHNISDELDAYAAQQEMINSGVAPPISVRNMVYTKDQDKAAFLSRYGLDGAISARDAFLALRETFEIDPTLTVREARGIMTLRNELSMLGYLQYVPVNIASGVSSDTVLQIEERSSELRGVSVATESVRYYPGGPAASHVLGYMGRISESQKERYVSELGYRPSDLIGLDGVENSLESLLKGTDGVKNIQVNSRGQLVSVVSETIAQKGSDVYLTIDMELQKSVEEALERGLSELQEGGTFESQWGDYKYREAQPNANVGAVVVIDVKTGEPLAIASAPSFDPNQFSTGISSEAWNALQSANPRDLLSPRPLYNVAAKTAVQPGSTFKPITAIAALESGLNPNTQLYDGRYVTIGNRAYRCLLYTNSGGSHGNVNLYQAIEVSCNYYFYDIASGMDYYRNRPLPFKDDISIEKIISYAKQFGLGVPSGIELDETSIEAPSAEKKMSSTKNLLKKHLLDNAEEYFDDAVLRDKTELMRQVDEIVGWTEENPTRSVILKRIGELGIRESQVANVTDTCKSTYFNYAQWTMGDVLNISIGQGENAYTPIQMANYIATMANGGTLNKVSLIRAIEGEGLVEKEQGTKVELSDPEHLDDVIEGMKRVVSGSGGSLRGSFSGLPVQVAAKTGTAQRSGKIQPPDEVEYIMGHLGEIDASLEWESVEAEMNRLLLVYPNIYSSANRAVRKAVINLSRYSESEAERRMDAFKDSYKPFAWVVAMAPVDDPQIAVSVLIAQGNSSGNAAPIAKEVIAKYMELDKDYEDYSLESSFD